MKILIIKAHPSPFGFTHKIADIYKDKAEKNGRIITVLDLYKPEWNQPYFAFENLKEYKPTEKQLEIQKLITENNHFVFIYPIWWLGMPGILKNFIDTNFSARFAFRYQKSGRPLGLLKGRTADIFITCDATGILGFLVKKFEWVWWKFSILGTCGIKLKKITAFTGMFLRSDEEKERLLNQI